MKTFIARTKKSDGYVAIESVLSMTVFFIILVAMIGLFLAVYPRMVLLQEMHSITRLAELQGGLTTENVQFYENRIGEFGFISDSSPIELTAVTESGVDASAIDGKGVKNPFYIKREDLDAIYVTLEVPIQTNLLDAALDFFGVSNRIKPYVFQELVYSERY